MNASRHLVHAIFWCLNCNRQWEHYLTAPKLARTHAEQHQHEVKGEIGLSVSYNGKAEPGKGRHD